MHCNLIQVIPWPTPIGNDGLVTMLDVGNQYIAISEERQSFIELTEREAEQCMKGIKVCSPTSVIYSQPITSCLYLVIRGEDTRNLCRYTVMDIVQPQFKLIEGTATWLYYMKESVRMTIKCLGKGPEDIMLVGSGTFHLPGNCSGHAPGIVVPRSFKAHTVVDVVHNRLHIPKIEVPQWSVPRGTGGVSFNTTRLIKCLKVHTLKEVKYLGQSIDKLKQDVDKEEELVALRQTVSELGDHSVGIWTIIGTIIAVVVIALSVYYLVQRRREQGIMGEQMASTNVTMEIPLIKVKDNEEVEKPPTAKRTRTVRTAVMTELENMIGRVNASKDRPSPTKSEVH